MWLNEINSEKIAIQDAERISKNQGRDIEVYKSIKMEFHSLLWKDENNIEFVNHCEGKLIHTTNIKNK